MNRLFISLFLLASTTLLAAPSKYICSNVGGTEVWTIYVDLNKKLAGFFDNDNTSTVPLKDIKIFDSRPPQTVYIFEGKDIGGDTNNDTLRISFNVTKMAGHVTFNPGKWDERTLKALDGCRADKNIDL